MSWFPYLSAAAFGYGWGVFTAAAVVLAGSRTREERWHRRFCSLADRLRAVESDLASLPRPGPAPTVPDGRSTAELVGELWRRGQAA